MNIKFTENGVRLIGSQHVVNNHSGSYNFVYSKDGKTGKLQVFADDDDNFFANKFMLRGTKETLEKIKSGDILVIPSQEQ
jgi:hypothetical protein